MAEASWITIAKKEIGQKRVPGAADNPRIVEYLKDTTLPLSFDHDETAWCAAFVSWCLDQAGVRSLKTAWAPSYGSYGSALSAPQPGCVVVFHGHVAFCLDSNANFVQVLGGNQGAASEVSVVWWPKSDVVAYRWPPAAQPVVAAPAPAPKPQPVVGAPGLKRVYQGQHVVAGADVSHWQPVIDFRALKASGVDYCFMKCSEGTGIVDASFDIHWKQAREAGLIRGAYHYFHPSQDPVEQARLVGRMMYDLRADDLPVALDWEATDSTPSVKDVAAGLAFLLEIQRITGRRPIIYTGPYFMQALNPSATLAQFPLWIAHYQTLAPLVPYPWANWAFWQTSGSAKVAGVQGAGDSDLFNGTLDELKAFIVASHV